jgi:DNA-binding transcriptional MerR regulator
MDFPILIPEYNVFFQQHIFEKSVYQSVIQSAEFYKKPIYTTKDLQKYFPSLSYRVLNDWDKKKLIRGSRKNQDSGWRKFSAIDIIKFFIITDLRKYGMPIPKIKNVIHDLSCNFVFIKDPHTGQSQKTEYLHFEYFFILSSIGQKILLLIDDRQYTLLHNEADMFDLISSKDFYAPCLLLPFYDYVRKFYKQLTLDIKIKKYSTLSGLLEARFHLKEKIIMDLVNNDKYKKIEIIRKNNDHHLITAKSIRSGKFNKKDVMDLIDQKEYQSVKAIKEEDGQIVAISQEERFWI